MRTAIVSRFSVLAMFTLVLALLVPTSARAQALSVDPGQGPAGISVTLLGAGFLPDTNLDVSWNGDATLAEPTTDAAGSFSATVTIPANAQPGEHAIEARRVLTSTLLASASFQVTGDTNAAADLLPSEIIYPDGPLSVGVQIRFDSGVSNTGNAETGVFNIRWLVDNQDVGAYGSHAGVPAQATVRDGNSQFDWTPTSEGRHAITFIVDVDNHVTESDEENNSATVEVTIAAPAPTPGRCSTTRFVGVHGLAEEALESNQYMGPTVFRMYNNFRVAARTAGIEALPAGVIYPTMSVDQFLVDFSTNLSNRFIADIRDGATVVAGKVEGAPAGNCIVIVGYSEGAAAVHEALRAHPDLADRISAVYLFGDPQFDAGATGFVEGARYFHGLIRYIRADQAVNPFFPDGLSGRAVSYCYGTVEQQDPICNFHTSNLLYDRLHLHGAYDLISDEIVAYLLDRLAQQP